MRKWSKLYKHTWKSQKCRCENMLLQPILRRTVSTVETYTTRECTVKSYYTSIVLHQRTHPQTNSTIPLSLLLLPPQYPSLCSSCLHYTPLANTLRARQHRADRPLTPFMDTHGVQAGVPPARHSLLLGRLLSDYPGNTAN